MFREKSDIEKAETVEQEAARLRGALFALSLISDPDEMKRIARAAMRGELHGHEPSQMKGP